MCNSPLTNIKNMFVNWLNDIDKKNTSENTNWSFYFVLADLEKLE
jgi:hypothetical protein